jgi:hypothetical protein
VWCWFWIFLKSESNQFQVFEKNKIKSKNHEFWVFKKIKKWRTSIYGYFKTLKEPPGFVKEQGNFRDGY